jgi:hypothetical protein
MTDEGAREEGRREKVKMEGGRVGERYRRQWVVEGTFVLGGGGGGGGVGDLERLQVCIHLAHGTHTALGRSGIALYVCQKRRTLHPCLEGLAWPVGSEGCGLWATCSGLPVGWLPLT